MAMQVSQVILGVDVAQQWVDVNRYGEDGVARVDNERCALETWVKRYSEAALAVEATNTYHELLVELALKHGLTVYLIDGYRLSRYADSLNVRMRNDRVDAKLLARFLDREIAELRPYEPKSDAVRELWALVKRRALLVKHNLQLTQSLAGLTGLQASVRAVLRANRRLIAVIEQRLRAKAKALGWQPELARLRTLPGIGELSALVLLLAYRSHPFAHRDGFIAFMGLDVKTKDSGRYKGKRKLSKKGDPEYRRVLYNAAMAARRSDTYFAAYFERLCARGIPTTGALVAIARKLAQLGFVLLTKQTDFDPSKLKGSPRAA